MARPFGFPPTLRLRKKSDIDPVFRQGQYHRLGWLQARTRPNGQGASRFMISVSRRAGPAPARNRVKRVVREAVRLNHGGLAAPHDVCLFVTRQPPGRLGLADAERELRRLFDRLAQPPHARVSDR
jgi:ribonuclease P protein component